MDKIKTLEDKLREAIDEQKRLWLLISLSEEYWKISDYSQSKLYAEAALELGKSINNEEAIGYSYHLIGTIYSYLDAYDIALEYHFLAQKSHARMDFPKREAEAYNSIADIYLKLGNQDKAKECFQKSHQLFPEYERTVNNLGYLEMLKDNYEGAISYYDKAGQLAEKSGNLRSKVISLINISDVLCKQNKPSEAISKLDQALEILNECVIETPNEIKMALLLNLGSAYCFLNDSENAFKHLSEAYDLATEHQNKVYLSKATYILSDYYKHLGDYPKAYEYLLEHNQLSSSILNSQVIEKASRIQSFYEKETRDLITMNMTERSSRLATMGILSNGITHEINQPLSAIRISAESILYWIKKESVILPLNFDEELNHIVEGSKRIEELIRQIKRFWNSGKADLKQENDINNVIQKCISPLNRRIYSHGINLQMELSPNLPSFTASEIHLQQIFINLLSYSIDTLSSSKLKQKQLCIRTIIRNSRLEALFLTNGTIFTQEQLDKLKNPFGQANLNQESELGLAIIKYYTDYYKIDFGLHHEDAMHGIKLSFHQDDVL
jgi:tetratricopeptide (TPR) repeat protein